MFFGKDIAYQGHQGHWLALGFDAESADALIVNRLERAFPAMHVKYMFTGNGRNPEQLKPGSLWVEGIYGYRLGIVADRSNGGNVLTSAYPWFEVGSEFTAEINEVQEFENELEARIHATIVVDGGQFPLCYFDPLYAEYRQYYAQDTKFQVRISAMAYGLKIDEPSNSPGLQAMQVYGPDDYRFQGIVHKIDLLQLFDSPAWRVWITVVNEHGAQMSLPIIVSEFSQYKMVLPKIGDTVSGHLWLQGWLWASIDFLNQIK